MDFKQAIADEGRRLGFFAIGVAKAEYDPVAHNRHLRWLDKGCQADMHYLESNSRRRFDPRITLPSAKSVIVCALNYYHKPQNDPRRPYISLYGRGENYHAVMINKLQALRQKIAEIAGRCTCKVYADDSPISEKFFAAKAGLGFIGRNGPLILSPHGARPQGSFYFLGSIITDLELEPDKTSDRTCANCQICMEACPTGAILGDGTINAGRCIAYHTMQNKGEIPPEIARQMGNIVFGCDICQAVCPHNENISETTEPRFAPDADLISPDLDTLVNLTEEAFVKRFALSSIGEKGYRLFRRNVAIAVENIKIS